MAPDLLPLPRAFREAAYRRKFIGNVDEHLFMGSYESFEAAAAAAPKSKPLGFDNAAEARRLFSQEIFFYDYPALFWIARSFEDGWRSVFDLGGHAGIKYYAFRRVLNYPAGMRWGRNCRQPEMKSTSKPLASLKSQVKLSSSPMPRSAAISRPAWMTPATSQVLQRMPDG